MCAKSRFVRYFIACDFFWFQGKAEGNKPALYLRAGLQHILFRLGCFIQRRSSEVLFLGVLILCLFSVGLRNATIETNMEKLWVESTFFCFVFLFGLHFSINFVGKFGKL